LHRDSSADKLAAELPVIPFEQALDDLGLADAVSVCPVPSGYPSPKLINLVLRRHGGMTLLFEASAHTEEIVEQIHEHLRRLGVSRLDGVLVTHCHGDHGGSAGVIAQWGRPPENRAPIYVHSASYRFLTHPDAAFLNETYELFLTRAHWGLLQYNELTNDEMLHNDFRRRYSGYFARTPKSDLRFVDHAQLPDSIWAVVTPGHSNDCVLYYDEELGIAVPGDTIICTGRADQPDTYGYVIPIFTVAGQSYSMAYERFLQTVRVLRRFFQSYRVRAVLPPHGKIAVTRPDDWVRFAEGYFEGIYRALLEDFLGDTDRRNRPFMAKDLNAFIPSAGAHPISTPSHTFGMLCALADEGYFALSEDPHTRQITFELERMPPDDYVRARLGEDPGPLPIFKRSQRPSSALGS
jgi:glyoxylase-like metal-dependent hydrolase (beta-lactamase superfamily II)